LVHDRIGQSGRETTRVTLTGWDARIAQHELDHLDGVLFIDRLEGRPLLPLDEVRKLRDAGHRLRGWLPPEPPATP